MSDHVAGVSLTDLSHRVTAAWARVQRLQEAVAKGASLLEGQSIRLSMEGASSAEELRVVGGLMLGTEESCQVYQQRLTYHLRIGKALDASYKSIISEEERVERDIMRLKLEAREAQLQGNKANDAVADALASVSGLRVELWSLQRELLKTNEIVKDLYQRQWQLEDSLAAAEDALMGEAEQNT